MQRIWQNRRKIGALIRAGFLLCLTIAIILGIDSYLRPVIKTMAAYQAKVYATEAINNAITDYLRDWEASGGRIVVVTYGERGEVSTVQTDIVALNGLKAEITRAVTEEITRLEEQSLQIPIGTLIGGQVFSGRGPRVGFKILPAGYVQTDITGRFDSAGINQTRHQIYVEVTASIVALLPGYTSSTEVSTNLCVAETVIIGAVPETFAEFYMDSTKFPSITKPAA